MRIIITFLQWQSIFQEAFLSTKKRILSSDQNVTLKDLLGHIFIVDMEFNQSKSNVHTLICNKRWIKTLVLEKKKKYWSSWEVHF